MRLDLDFERKVVTIKSEVNLKEFNDKIKEILTDWKEWKVEAVKQELTYFPIGGTTTVYPIINTPIQYPLPNQPTFKPDWEVTCNVGQYSIN